MLHVGDQGRCGAEGSQGTRLDNDGDDGPEVRTIDASGLAVNRPDAVGNEEGADDLVAEGEDKFALDPRGELLDEDQICVTHAGETVEDTSSSG